MERKDGLAWVKARARPIMVWGICGAVAATYFAVRLMSATPIDQPLNTREGIQERAAAAVKQVRYQDMMGTRVRRGGWLMGFVFWPIKPTDAEFAGAQEFANLAFEARSIKSKNAVCDVYYSSSDYTEDEDSIYVKEMALFILRKDAEWPPEPALRFLDSTSLNPANEVKDCSPPER